jgi:uncharacterized protein (DUF433 family)
MIWYNAVTMQKYIASTPDIMGGAPVIKGTRTPIEVILYRLKEGNSVEAIHEMYPWIEVQTLSGAIEEAIQTVTTTLHAKTVPQTQAAAR